MKDWLPAFINSAQLSNHRLPLIISGNHNWAEQQLIIIKEIMACEPSLWSNNKTWLPQALPWKKARKLLGHSINYLVLDLTEEIPADALGAVTGALKGGGLLVMICPQDMQWSQTSCFIKRTGDILADSNILHWQESLGLSNQQPVNQFCVSPQQDQTLFPCVTSDQQQAVTAAKRVLTGHRRRPLVLTADRGRGKSAALGIAAAQLMQERSLRILVTGPSLQATDTLFHHAQLLLDDALCSKGHIKTETSELLFIAPDELAGCHHEANLVLVDEAAAIPAPLLTKLLRQYSRIIFASTVHGYEGTGRGFAVRFRKTLDQITPKWQPCKMQQPIRWAESDPLEQLLAKLLLLDAEPASSHLIADARQDNVNFLCFTSGTLQNNPELLAELFGLLVLAHYQTSPDDLQQVLNQDHLTVFALLHNGHIAATALVSHEGEFDRSLAEAVWAGERRVKGHLLPQTLATHAGHQQAPTYKWGRIMRVAVHPDIQSRGLGQYFISCIEKELSADGYDLIGSSFGATADLLHFWNSCGLTPVHMGSTRNKASGCHSAVVIKGLSEQGEKFSESACLRFSQTLPFQAMDGLSSLESDILLSLFSATNQPALSHEKIRRLENFIAGKMNYDACLPEIHALARSLLPQFALQLSTQQQQLLALKLLQGNNWEEAIKKSQMTGKKMAEQELIHSTMILLKAVKDS